MINKSTFYKSLYSVKVAREEEVNADEKQGQENDSLSIFQNHTTHNSTRQVFNFIIIQLQDMA